MNDKQTTEETCFKVHKLPQGPREQRQSEEAIQNVYDLKFQRGNNGLMHLIGESPYYM